MIKSLLSEKGTTLKCLEALSAFKFSGLYPGFLMKQKLHKSVRVTLSEDFSTLVTPHWLYRYERTLSFRKQDGPTTMRRHYRLNLKVRILCKFDKTHFLPMVQR